MSKVGLKDTALKNREGPGSHRFLQELDQAHRGDCLCDRVSNSFRDRADTSWPRDRTLNHWIAAMAQESQANKTLYGGWQELNNFRVTDAINLIKQSNMKKSIARGSRRREKLDWVVRKCVWRWDTCPAVWKFRDQPYPYVCQGTSGGKYHRKKVSATGSQWYRSESTELYPHRNVRRDPIIEESGSQSVTPDQHHQHHLGAYPKQRCQSGLDLLSEKFQ